MAKKTIDEKALFDAALREFSRHTYEEASVNRIIADAGITKGSFYYRFSNKYDLYIYVLKEGNRRKWEFINSRVSDTHGAGTDIFDFLEFQAELGVRFAIDHPGYHQLSSMFLKEKGKPLYTQALTDLNASDESGISDMIEKAFNSGVFREEFSPDFVTKLVQSLFLSFHDIFFRDEEYEINRALDYVREFIMFLKKGLKA